MTSMSHSTTSTATYVLTKYSKSYPPPSDQSQGLDFSTEWQHFVNPIIKLTLEAKKSNNGALESVRLRILWLMNTGNEGEKEVVFEDIDLLSFSSLTASNSFLNQKTLPGLPLKAVYRDSLVGIRYLHPRVATPDCPSVYRRFQITFMSDSAALQFIESIRMVCPCKINPTPVPNRNPTFAPALTKDPENTPPPSRIPKRSGTIAFAPSGPTSSPLYSQSVAHSSPVVPLTSSPNFSHPSPQVDNLPTFNTSLNRENTSRPSASSLTTLSFTPNQRNMTQKNVPVTDYAQNANSQSFSGNFGSRGRPIQSTSTNYQQLDSSPPSSNAATTTAMMPPPPPPPRPPLSQTTSETQPTPPQGPSRNATQEAFLASLRETPTLYNLPEDELENLVAEVVREEGFARTLEKLDAMWKVKAFLGR